ncbi:enolase C-terminal domain-like protein [Arthrobacter sp. H5]|uniref:enolase C-terminal domain-like protein n=1 Tax=Arthrobacter sp. H5 TaxID=1267973 RepID=UPI0009E0B4A9|nr:enolase C-terminal domain-like protein [Arthrobacter sp. H5]
MKITSLEVLGLREPVSTSRSWWSTTPLDVLHEPTEPRLQRRQPGAERGEPISNVVVVIHAEDGTYGLGTVGVGSPVAISVISHHLADLVVGSDAFETERTWNTMHRNTIALGRKGIVMEAISAIDIALWDLKAKLIGQPVYNLLGGRVKQTIRAYASELYAREDLESLHREATALRNAGFSAVKMRFGYGPAEGRAGMRANQDLVRTVREAVGDDVDIAAEAYMGWDTAYAIRMINSLDEYGLAWIEEPVLPDNLQSYAYVRSRVGVPISGGEHEFGLTGFRDMIEAGAVDILQPDVNRMGGITEAAKVWALAEAYDIPVIPHSNQAHNAHLIASHYSSPLIEVFPEPGVEAGYNFYQRFFDGEPRAHGGTVVLGGSPGLGLTLVPGVINAHLAVRKQFGRTPPDLLAQELSA